ncbi:calcium-transporting P-type ATPase, PMR1-type [Desulfoscipio gibsoniae]|uniref:P-type Ca(2+) transporter n=1 Tax=Desulfoscipio gibsoniae DSM 7213 TaxID=767817 RepID=R4KGR0_9FIRM|nr:calcium-transporting P-type ATPase, PMR1-type [Desulfoscipio gibsoniae]AGL02388.1 sarco/endoplasmic reticulum calcium-translocating P-type ATPase/golgi membrane calcium-translocating P-type ATPase [Desulfoscipio gibsoniae DSM 7213]
MPEIWQTLSAEETALRLEVDTVRGLTDGEAHSRMERVGPNVLERGPDMAMWQMFLNQFKDFMVLVLLAATAISGFLGEWSDAVTISIIVLLNAILGVVQEYRAERSMEALRELASPEARVIRNRMERKIPAAELMPGDIVLLEAGDRVPADIRLIQTMDLEAVEAVLTGESTPVRKHTRPLENAAGPADAGNMVFMGTALTRGRGKGIVVATGMASEMGQIAGMIQEAEQEPTPLQKRLAQLGRGLVFFCLAVCAMVVVVGVLRGEAVYQMFLTGVSLAVAAIPEGLPAIVTVALAIGVQRMIRRHAIIRRLPAVETLGCATFICSDKTGTLTKNEMTVRRVYLASGELEVSGEGYDPKGKFSGETGSDGPDFDKLMSVAALCNNATLYKDNISVGGLFRKLGKGKDTSWHVEGDPTEGALLVLAAKAGSWRERLEKKARRLAEIPFDSERKRMTVIYREGGKTEALVKGAPDIVLKLCTHYLRDGHAVPLDTRTRNAVLEANSSMADGALRVLGLAYRELPSGISIEQLDAEEIERKLVFVGLAGMIDPPRPSAISAVRTCRRAGIRVAMITGDHQLTAQAVAREMGIAGRDSKVLTGEQLEQMSDEELASVADDVCVYARVSPRHKLRIVRALKHNGHVVAMTGDGVNDAPAIKEADIGIAMGITGTDVTREASAMVLTDDNFTSIVAAVEEGRGIYDNIRKFIRYLLSCNVGEVLVMFLAVLGGMPLPLLPIQILWMNLVTDGLPAMALGLDPIDRDIMRRPPRDPQESIFSHALGRRIVSSGMVIAVLTLVVFGLAYADGHNLDLARTMAFNTLVFLQLFFVFSCRSEHLTIRELGVMSNPHLVWAVLISTTLQMGVNYLPFLQPIFHTVPLSLHQWLTVVGVALLPTLAGIIQVQLSGRLREKVTYIKV